MKPVRGGHNDSSKRPIIYASELLDNRYSLFFITNIFYQIYIYLISQLMNIFDKINIALNMPALAGREKITVIEINR
jgi:hypothetical protein